MVDTLALGASGATREGSSPFIRTIEDFQIKRCPYQDVFLFSNLGKCSTVRSSGGIYRSFVKSRPSHRPKELEENEPKSARKFTVK